MLALLAGPLGRLLGILALVASLAGGVAYVRHEVRRADLAEAAVASRDAAMKAADEAHGRQVAALEQAASDAAARAARSANIKASIHDAPSSAACAAAPAVRAVLDGLRDRPTGGYAPAAKAAR
jgi:hypothetical protein